MSALQAKLLIGGAWLEGDESSFHGVDPVTEARLAPEYRSASPEEARAACGLARDAFASYRKTPLAQRAGFLEMVASEIEAISGALVERAMAETGLAQARLSGELARTTGQLRTFAALVRDGNFLERHMEPAMPERKPAPRPELRYGNIPLGPVAVFGAGNFPLAFSVAGGDTAAALASGCPVVCKAHPAHPGTSELTAQAIHSALEQAGLHPGVFALLFDAGHDIGEALVLDPNIKALAFTGSQRGGLALARLAAKREVPIPVYAEMGSINPLFLLPGALAGAPEGAADGWLASLQMGAGQFCTNPGVAVAIAGEPLSRFKRQLSQAAAASAPQSMLTAAIHGAYLQAMETLGQHPDTAVIAQGPQDEALPNGCQVHVFETTAKAFMADPGLREEVFGACGLLVACDNEDETLALAEGLAGQLTATIHAQDEDRDLALALVEVLENKAGRIVFNGYPTGVEISPAMVHGGPFPATTDARSSSVGATAIRRFLRPVCYQDCPAGLAAALFGDDCFEPANGGL